MASDPSSRRDAKGNVVGELDLAITHPTDPAAAGGCGLEVVAIVEMKAAVFEMAAAAAQHTDRIVNVELRLVPAGGDASPLQLRPAAGGGGGGGLAWVGGVAVFVATLVPPQPYQLGADPLVVRAVSEAIYGRRKDATQGGAPGRSWEQTLLSPDDAAGCAELMGRVRAAAKAKGHALALSPRGFASAACGPAAEIIYCPTASSGDISWQSDARFLHRCWPCGHRYVSNLQAILLVMGQGEVPTPSGFTTWRPMGGASAAAVQLPEYGAGTYLATLQTKTEGTKNVATVNDGLMIR
jgi:hypothetical protein